MITPAILSDASLVAALVNSAYRGESSKKGWTTEADLLDGTRTDAQAIEEIIRRKGTIILKYVQDNEIVGCVELDHRGDQLYLGMLTVKPGLQGGGIGKHLLQAAEDEARRQQCRAIFMTVISIRKELIDWYLRHEYKDTGERKPFVVPDTRWGVPKRSLEFAVLRKELVG